MRLSSISSLAVVVVLDSLSLEIGIILGLEMNISFADRLYELKNSSLSNRDELLITVVVSFGTEIFRSPIICGTGAMVSAAGSFFIYSLSCTLRPIRFGILERVRKS